MLPGLFQTEDYARAILAVRPGADPDTIDEHLTGRMDRQAILDRADAPHIWSIIDEGVLHRRIGDSKIMRDQLEHLVDLSARPKVGVQVVPLSAGTHAGLLGAFIIADVDGSPGMVYSAFHGESAGSVVAPCGDTPWLSHFDWYGSPW